MDLEMITNPFVGYSRETQNMIFEMIFMMLDEGPVPWFGKEETPTSLEIPCSITEKIKDFCKKKNITQWEFEKQLYTYLVFEGLLFSFMKTDSKFVEIITKETREKIKEFVHDIK